VGREDPVEHLAGVVETAGGQHELGGQDQPVGRPRVGGMDPREVQELPEGSVPLAAAKCRPAQRQARGRRLRVIGKLHQGPAIGIGGGREVAGLVGGLPGQQQHGDAERPVRRRGEERRQVGRRLRELP
jgi:hypothetical protein